MKVLPVSCSLISLLGVTAPTALAQPITPAQDGTGTIINQNDDRFDITGGSLGGDRSNLFHSFQQFNLNANQTANFISAPNIHNILGRVTGGDASIINGLLRVTGGNSNLYLINPAGVIFGPNARLDVPASFSVTTATGIGFGNNWFEAIGSNDYRNLVGTPNRYRFDLARPGAIVNSGKLELSPEQNLTLAGGTVINTGEISTPGGNVTIAAVEGGDTVRISQPGHLLNLEISNGGVGEREQITPLSLPSLLTEGNFSDRVTGIIVNENGEVILTGSRNRVSGGGTAIASGTIDTSSSNIGGEVNVIGSRVGLLNANINADGINGGGSVFVGGDFQGNNRLPASQQTVINNNTFISANAIENGDGGRVIIWSDGTTRFEGNISATGGEFAGNGGLVEVSGKEQLFVDGFIDVTASNGESGTILFDPENIEIGLATDVVTDETDGLSGGENIEGLEEKDTETTAEETSEVEESANPFAPDEDFNVTISADNLEELEGNVTLQADNDITVNEGIETSGSVELKAGRSININADIDTSRGNGNIALFANDNNANIANRSSGAGNITQRDGTTLNAGSGNIRMRLGSLGEVGDINLANLTTSGRVNIDANGGNIGQVSPNSLLAAGEVILLTSGRGGIGLSRTPLRVDVDNLEAVSGRGGAFFDALGRVTVGGVTNEFGGISTTGGGDVELSAERKVTVSEEISTAVRRGRSGNIEIESRSGGIDTTAARIDASSESRRGGDISLTAARNVRTADVNSSAGGDERGGNINVVSREGAIDTTEGTVDASSSGGDGGRIEMEAGENITTADIRAYSVNDEGYLDGRGNSIILNAGLNIDTSAGRLQSFGQTGGKIKLTADGNITTHHVDSNGEYTSGSIIFNAQNDINTSAGDLDSIQGAVKLTADGDIITGNINSHSIIIESGGNIDTSSGTLLSFSSVERGEIRLTATENITTGNINVPTDEELRHASWWYQPYYFRRYDINSNVFLKAGNQIDTRLGAINSSSENEGSNTTIIADGNIYTGNINSWGGQQGGNIEITSTAGAIDTSAGELNSSSTGDIGGNITLTAGETIITGNIDASGSLKGGKVVIKSNASDVDTTDGELTTTSPEGTDGNIAIEANEGSIAVGEINGRNITVEDASADSASAESSEGDISTDADEINQQRGEVSLQADNDITINEAIASDSISNLELKAGRNININADIDISGGNGNITLRANDETVNPQYRESGSGNIAMASGTTLNAGRGDISLELGNFAEVGNITLNNLRTTGTLTVNANGGNILRATDNSFIRAGSAIFETIDNGGIGLSTKLLRVQVNNLEARTGSGGIFLNSPNQGVTIGNATEDLDGILTSNGGDVGITANGDIIATKPITTSTGPGRAGNITLNATGAIDTTAVTLSSTSNDDNAGNITLNAEADILTANIRTQTEGNGRGGNITLNAGRAINTTRGTLDSSSTRGDGGNVTLKANRDINTSFISSSGSTNQSSESSSQNINGYYYPWVFYTYWRSSGSSSGGNGGDITIESRNGRIDTTARVSGDNLPSSVDSSDFLTNRGFSERLHTFDSNLKSEALDGIGGRITLNARNDITASSISSFGSERGGNVRLISREGNISVQDIFSTQNRANNAEGVVAGNVTIATGHTDNSNVIVSQQATSSGNISINNIATFSQNGRGGNVNINATGNFTVNNLISYGLTQSGNIRVTSRSSEIQTGHIMTQADEGPSGNIFINGREIATGNLSSIGTISAGKIRVEAVDGSIRTEDITSSAPEGAAGGIELEADEDIDIGKQTVTAAEGDADIEVKAGGDVSSDDQTATTSQGNANIEVEAGGNANITDQTATANRGNAKIQVRSGGGITGENQTATATDGSASINNQAGTNIAIANNQTATAQGGNAIINNEAGRDITAGDQTATAQGGNAIINNEAGRDITAGNQTATSTGGNATINNNAGRNLTTGEQTAIAPDGITAINNSYGRNNLTPETTPGNNNITPSPNNNPVLSVENNAVSAIANPTAAVGAIAQPIITNQATQNPVSRSQPNSTPTPTNPQIAPTQVNLNPGRSQISNPTPANLNPTSPPVAISNPAPANLNPTSPPVANSNPTPANLNPVSPPVANSTATSVNVNPISPPVVNSPLATTAIAPTSTPTINNNNPNPVLTIDSSLTNAVTAIARPGSNAIANANNSNGEINSNTNLNETLERVANLNSFNLVVSRTLAENSPELIALEESRTQEYLDYFEEDLLSLGYYLKNPREILANIAQETGNKSAIIYVISGPESLQLVLYSSSGEPIITTVPGVTEEQLSEKNVGELIKLITKYPEKHKYLPLAQQFYSWLISPIIQHLEEAEIDTLIFSMDAGLRRLPLAALHDGEQFLIEKYSLGIIPSVSLMDSRYRSVEGTRVLGMGVDTFTSTGKNPLPGVPLELQVIEELWQSDSFLNSDFTRDNLIAQREIYPYEIIHLATHSTIDRSSYEFSYIQLWGDEKLRLSQIRELGWNNPPVELFILSSCRGAVENEYAELGFASLAVAAGVKSTIAGLWAVDDGSTLALMSEFYSNLDEVAIKAEALRKAQLAMIKGDIIIEDGLLWISGQDNPYSLPSELQELEDVDLSHPYYWSGFTIIGSPW